RQMVLARFRHFRPGPERLRNPRSESASWRHGPKRAAQLPEPGALRHRLGRAGRCDGLLRHRARIRQDAQAVRGQTDCLAPTGSGETRLDDHGNRERAASGAARRAFERQRQSRRYAHFHAEDEQRRHRSGYSAQSSRHSGSQRDRRRLLRDAAHEQPGERVHLRGHQRHSQADHRRKDYGYFRVCLKPMQIQLRRFLLSFAALFSFLVFVSVCGAQNPPQAPKPKVRTVTAFINIERGRYQIQVSEAADFLKKAKTTFEKQGYTVETLRIVTQPFPEYTRGVSRAEALQFFKNLDGVAQQEHLMISIGPAYLSGEEGGAQADLLADILK